jgi:hypothetical protein
MTTKKVSPGPTTGRKFLKYLLWFVGTLGAGISPLLLGGKIPGFRAILDVFPADLQDVIPWASLLMSVTAVGVQFFGGQSIDARRLRRGFIATYALLVLSIFVLYFQYKATVIRLQVPGANTKVAYLVGSTLLPTCECAKRGLQIRDCIGRVISVNPDEVAACYPLREITTRASILSALYMFVMFSLGTLIGLLVLRESVPRPGTRRLAKSRRTRETVEKPSSIKGDPEE